MAHMICRIEKYLAVQNMKKVYSQYINTTMPHTQTFMTKSRNRQQMECCKKDQIILSEVDQSGAEIRGTHTITCNRHKDNLPVLNPQKGEEQNY